ncbi:MAG TPA: hypothetical protein ENH12_06490 [Proteobacteria bacterium]|nr:hypothetical protein [Pseudomonadota bacterium]
MNCKTFNRLLPGYLYGESSIEEGEKVLSHARTCPDCRRLLDEMTGTISLLREEAKPHFSGGEMAALRMRVKQEIAGMDHSPARSPVRPRLSFFSRPLFLPAAGALIAASIVAVLLYHPAETPENLLPTVLSEAEELVTMTETVEEEYESVDELCREMDELQQLFFQEPDPGSEAEIGSDKVSVPV